MRLPVVFDLVTGETHEGTDLYALAEKEGKEIIPSNERGPELKKFHKPRPFKVRPDIVKEL